MKFSFSAVKKLAPGSYSKSALVEKLNLHSFEAVDMGGDIIDISVTPNRFGDAASYLGIAREAAVIFGLKFKSPVAPAKADVANSDIIAVNVKDKKFCDRYLAAYATDVRTGPSPAWLKGVLEASGIRSINNVVDVMNYVMLETGQPMHAFDADHVKGGFIVVRKASAGETIETLDGGKYVLSAEDAVIADMEKPLAIAGIKGGASSGVSPHTRHIIVEAAHFDSVAVYKTSRRLNLRTDASVRFSHALSPELAAMGMERALALLKEIAHAKTYKTIDIYPKKQSKKLLKLDMKRLAKLIGVRYPEAHAARILEGLGFAREKKLWRVPAWRTDVSEFEDVAEEIVRFVGYDALPAAPPAVALGFAAPEESVLLKGWIREFLRGAGVNEVYNYSFIPAEDVSMAPRAIFQEGSAAELLNPASSQFACLRDSLAPGLAKNLRDNGRFYDEVKIFEIGSVFSAYQGELRESVTLGIALMSKNGMLELKGLIDALFTRCGLTDWHMPDLESAAPLLQPKESLRIETGDHQVLGYCGAVKGIRQAAIAEIRLDRLLQAVSEEKEYEPLSKYPSIMRDVSLLVAAHVRVGDILSVLQNASPKLVNDVDLMDFYEDEKIGKGKKSLTFRIIFQSDERTLTDAEADKEMAIIAKVLQDRFDAEIR